MQNNFMQNSINLAKKSGNDIPVGCTVVKDGEIIAEAFNKKERDCDISAHAEILALKEASKKLKNWRLSDCDIYVTLEPCPMCAWAILNARVKNVYFGAYDTKYGAFGGALNLSKFYDFKPNIYGGIMEEECESIIKEYFKKQRAAGKDD